MRWKSKESKKAIVWKGEGLDEVGIRSDTNDIVIRVDKRYFRPLEVQKLLGDSSKAKLKLGWQPSITIEQIVSEMVENDINKLKKNISN